jgi:hypothetical protein
MAHTKHLHGVPLLTARRRDAATVERVCRRLRRQMYGLGDDGPHGFGARGGRTLLGFGNTLTQPLLALAAASTALVRAEIASRVGDSGKDMDRELGARRVVAANEVASPRPSTVVTE